MSMNTLKSAIWPVAPGICATPLLAGARMARLQSVMKRVFIPPPNRWVVVARWSVALTRACLAPGAQGHTNPQSGIEGKIRFEGLCRRPIGIEGAELWGTADFDLQGGRDREEVRKQATAQPQADVRALPRDHWVMLSRTSQPGSKSERRSPSPNRNPSALRGSRRGREQA